MNTPNNLSTDDLLKLDRLHVWHPYSCANSFDPIYPVASAAGSEIVLTTGERLIDGMASWWSVIHGYNHPELNRALSDQANKMSHVMFGGMTHEPAVRLAKTLVDISPPNLDKVFFSDSGSVAVEVAMKMALQYWQASTTKQRHHKHRFLSLKNGYHGDTFGAMSVCDPVTGMHQLFSDVLQKNLFAQSPACGFYEEWNESYLADITQRISKNANELAAVILEPIVQGAGGMNFYHPEFLKGVRRLCDEHNVLLIADEIATGLGRTGKLFACEHADISPDMLCLGKTLTAGYISLAATLCSNKVADQIGSGSPGVFMHGPTYMGNPLACAVAQKSIELLLSSHWEKNISRINTQLKNNLAPAMILPGVANVRTLGGIGVIEMHNPVSLAQIQPQFVKEGIWLRPFGKLVYMIPSYSISDNELTFLCKKTIKVLSKH